MLSQNLWVCVVKIKNIDWMRTEMFMTELRTLLPCQCLPYRSNLKMSFAAPFTYILLKNNASNHYKTLTSGLLFLNVAHCHLDFICCFSSL